MYGLATAVPAQRRKCLSLVAAFSLYIFLHYYAKPSGEKHTTPALLPETSTQANMRLKWYSAVRSCIHARPWMSQHQVSTRQVARTPLPSKHKPFQRDICISGGNHNPDSDPRTFRTASFHLFFFFFSNLT